MSLGVDEDDLRHFFGGEHGALHTSFEGLELPGELAEFLSTLPLLQDEVPDRYVIYVDGSSHSARHHHSTDWIEEFGTVDAWAMIVLAEIYATPTTKAKLLVVGWTAQQVRYAVDSPAYLGADRVGSLIAEREGLTWALLWRICCNISTPTIVRCDSQLTCRQARGEVGAAQVSESFQCLRGAYQLLETALPQDHFRVEHISGHSGEPFNDFTDLAAKHEALHSFYLPRLGLDMRKWRPILPHLWMIFGEQWGGPSFCGTGFNICAPALPPAQVRDPDVGTSDGILPQEVTHGAEIQLCPCFCTANVLSLYTSPHGHAGKLGYLIEQFQAHALLFMGLQESRTPTGQISSHGVLRLCSGAHKGQGGTELWVNLAQSYGYARGKPLKFARQHFQVLEADPHLLLVSADAPHFQCLLVVAHAPHSGHPEPDRLSWWDSCTQRILRHRHQKMLFVMIDANAGPGERDDIAVLQSGLATTVNTPHWRSFLQSCDLALPQTLQLHEGGLETWISLDGSTGHCIDYVAVPCSLLPSCTYSGLLTHLDLGNVLLDHTPVAVELRWTTTSSLRPIRSKSTSRASFNRAHILTADLHKFLEHYRPSAWECDVECQVDEFNANTIESLRQLCPPCRQGPKKPFITEDIWRLRARKLHHRKKLKQIHAHLRFETAARIFQFWKRQGRSPDDSLDDLSFQYGTSLRCDVLFHHCAFRHFALRLEWALQSAKRSVLAEHIDQIPANASASHILHTLRPFIGSSKNLGPQPLPFVEDRHGEPCPDSSAALDRWIEFFGDMEGGMRMDLQTQRNRWLDNLRALQAQTLNLQVADIPSLTELEAALRRVQPGKATGPDDIPAEICKRCPAQIAKCIYPLLLKILFHGQETLLHKGGKLHPLWKGKLAQSCCAAYRSILISSHIGKSLHRALRMHQSTIYETYLQRQQIGGQRRAPVTLGVHMTRAYLRTQIVVGRPVALLFLDLSEAFYRVIRPLALSGVQTDLELGQLVGRLGLSDSVLHDLQAHLQSPSATERACLPDHLSRAVRALHLDTHWTIGEQPDVCRTTIGTRPGDAWADVVFGYLWARVLSDFQRDVSASFPLDTFPADEGPCLFNRQVATSLPASPFLGVSWMDDLAVAISAESCDLIVAKARGTTGILLDHCIAHGMQPNLSAGKTEFLFALHGAGHRKLRTELYGPFGGASTGHCG